MLTPFPSSFKVPGWFTFLEPGQTWVPSLDYHGADGAVKHVPANESLGVLVPVPLWIR